MATLPSPTQVAGEYSVQFESYYKKVDPSNSGTIQAGPAAGFLKKSALNDNILSRIWDISDPGGKGYLDKAGFFVALKMVALVQNGKEPTVANININTPPPNMGEPPPHPPPPTKPAPPQQQHPPAPAGGVWTITPADRTRYDQIFNTLGPEANKLHGNKVRSVMLNSKLPMEVLGKIWDLSDMDKDGSLDRVEFSIAMHLIYKVLENNPVPPAVPQEMLSSAQRAGVAQGPVPAPLAPPGAQVPPANTPKQPVTPAAAEKPSGPPPAPWVISAAEKARYDVMFHNADLDKDGYVSGNEIKGVFLQSGLPQMVLAHIWNLCDMKQTGKLTSEQFALAMWFIQQKLAGTDPPAALTPEMIPPTMRPKPAAEAAVVPAKPQYSNPELQLVADEIDELNSDKLKLESEIQQKEASIRLKNNEIKNLQTELDTLTSTLKQLEHQKGAAQQRLDDLGTQKKQLEAERNDLQAMIDAEQEEVSKLRVQVEEQETSLKAQEEEVMSKRQELTNLKNEESQLEDSVTRLKKRIDQLANTQQDTQLHISQARIKITELQEQEQHMTEVLSSYDSAISSGDASSLSEASLREVTPTFSDSTYLHIGPSPTTSPKESPNEPTEPQENGVTPQDTDNNPKVKDTSFRGGHDPFASAFGGQQNNVDVFGSWDQQHQQQATSPVPVADPFGGDAFASQNKGANDPFGSEPFGESGGPPPRPESPTPALPPKKAKQPPPRPAPPKTRPAKPPPPNLNSNNNPQQTNNKNANDPFGGGWGDNKTQTANNGGFADFANFADFDAKCSKVVGGSPTSTSPWGDDATPRETSDLSDNPNTPRSTPRPTSRPTSNLGGRSWTPNQTSDFSDNPNTPRSTPRPTSQAEFADPFSSKGGPEGSPWPAKDPFGSTKDPFSSGDPFGDYDPFKDHGTKESEFSWEDEPDPFTFTDQISGSTDFSTSNPSKTDPFAFNTSTDQVFNSNTSNTDPFNTSNTSNKFASSTDNSAFTNLSASKTDPFNTSKSDPFAFMGDSNANINANIKTPNNNDDGFFDTPKNSSQFDTSKNNNDGFFDTHKNNDSFFDTSKTSSQFDTQRSKSAIGDPFVGSLKDRDPMPLRSKTSLGQPGALDLDFDPFSTAKVTPAEKSRWKSNEDLLNENLSDSRFGNSKNDNFFESSPFGDNFTGLKGLKNNNEQINTLKQQEHAFKTGLKNENKQAFGGFKNEFKNNNEHAFKTGLKNSNEQVFGGFKNEFKNNNEQVFGAFKNNNEQVFGAFKSEGELSESEQLAWAAEESIRLEERRRMEEEQERVELELALTLSRANTTRRSPSTGL